MNPSYYVDSYAAHLRGLRDQHGEAKAMELLVGGDIHGYIGVLEQGVLLNLGLKPDDYVIDVGCGTGRLSGRLAPEHKGRFLGTDLLPEVVGYAQQKANRPDWRFEVVVAPPLPVPDNTADFVTFFSVFTHIMDEDIYLYLRDAGRALKPGGKIVFSYLDYCLPSHWPVFEQSLADATPNRVLTRFLDRRTIEQWAGRLGMKLHAIHDGTEAWIHLDLPLVTEAHWAPFWQSVAILEKP